MCRDEDKKKKRQTFVFSATLTFIHQAPQRIALKKKTKKKDKEFKMTQEKKLGRLQSEIKAVVMLIVVHGVGKKQYYNVVLLCTCLSVVVIHFHDILSYVSSVLYFNACVYVFVWQEC